MKEDLLKAIQKFFEGSLSNNALELFDTLGYNTSRRFDLSQSSFEGFANDFPDAADKMNIAKAKVGEWLSIELLFQITSEEMQENVPLFTPTLRREEPASYLFFSVELIDKNWTQHQLSQIVREINKGFPMHVFVLFKFGTKLSLSLIDRRPNKKIKAEDVLEKVTHVHGISIVNPHSAHIQILQTFSLQTLIRESKKRRIENFADLQTEWRKVLSTQVLNRQFYLDYQKLSKKLIRAIYPKHQPNKLLAHQGVLNLLNRLMFVFFVQKKGWLNHDENFMPHFWREYYRVQAKTKCNYDSTTDTTFHEHWLNTLFFAAFNGRMQAAFISLPYLPETMQVALIGSPYLNGGLFARNEELDEFLLPDQLFDSIFDYFEGYIFTISEDTPLDVNLEINPELLGKMYEGMINATDLDDVDAENGIVYTERPEINFMVRRSLVEVLDKKLNPVAGTRKFSREFLYHFVFDEPVPKRDIIQRYKANSDALRQAVMSLTACDPACGSGSMLLGVIQVQMELIRTLDEHSGRPHSGRDDFLIKKQLISECIYGVDIKEWAVRIAELRLWLYMIAEADYRAEELTKSPLLPNLDFKLRQGNSLLQKFGTMDFNAQSLFSGRKRNQGATRQLNEFVKLKKAYIVNQEESGTTYKKLKDEEFRVFQQFITELIEENVRKIKDIRRGVGGFAPQGNLFEQPTPKQGTLAFDETEIKTLEAEIEQFKALRKYILDQDRLPFSYDIDFMEVFLVPEDPGFDLIIGNPPYVRQEQILPPEDGEYLEYLLQPENEDKKKQVNKALKGELSAKTHRTFPFLQAKQKLPVFDTSGNPVLGRNGKARTKDMAIYGDKVPGRSDLYSYFQLLCPALLNGQGTFCFIISNSWLDVEFGAYVQHFLLRHTHLLAIYDCSVRSFDAAVNTIIYLHGPLRNTGPRQTALPNWGTDEGGVTQFVMNKVDYAVAAYAPLLIEQENCRIKTFQEHYRLIPLTANELYQNGFDEEKHKYFGDKWGGKHLRAPEIYYLILRKGKDKLVSLGKVAYVKSVSWSRMGFNSEVIFDSQELVSGSLESVAVFKSPKDVKKIELNSSDTISKLLLTPNVKNKVVFADLLWVDLRNEKHLCHICKEEVAFTHNFHGIDAVSLSKESLGLHLNSSLTCLFVEVIGRSNLGEGAIRILANDLSHHFPILNQEITISNTPFFTREQFDIFTELGFDRTLPIRSQQPDPLADRKALDDLIFDVLDLTTEERNEVYWAVGELVQNRLDKAASR